MDQSSDKIEAWRRLHAAHIAAERARREYRAALVQARLAGWPFTALERCTGTGRRTLRDRFERYLDHDEPLQDVVGDYRK